MMPRKRKSSKPAVFALLSCTLLVITCCATCGSDSDRDQAQELQASPSPSVSPSTRPVSTKVDEAARGACRSFALNYSASLTTSYRRSLASEVAYYAEDTATAGIRQASDALVKSVPAGRKAWKASAGKFTALCKKRGWKGLSADDRELRKMLADIRSGRSSYGDGSSSGGGNNGGSRRRGRFW